MRLAIERCLKFSKKGNKTKIFQSDLQRKLKKQNKAQKSLFFFRENHFVQDIKHFVVLKVPFKKWFKASSKTSKQREKIPKKLTKDGQRPQIQMSPISWLTQWASKGENNPTNEQNQIKQGLKNNRTIN